MSIDEKTAFYFRHRAEIEEWAALRDSAREALITELWALTDRLLPPADDGAVSHQREGQWSQVGLTKPRWRESGWPLSIVLAWNSGQLLNPLSNNEWAYVGVYFAFGPDDPAPRAQSTAIRELCLPAARELGLTQQHVNFPVWGFVVPPHQTRELSQYTDQCVTEFRSAWSALHPKLDDLVRGAVGPA